MNKVKSIFAFLVLGSLTLTGCDLFKKKDKSSGDEVVDRYTNKKLNFESSDVPQYETAYQGTYCSLFSEGDFEIVLGSYFVAGDYSLSENKQTATLTVKSTSSASGKHDFPEDQWSTMVAEYDASTSKYCVASTNEQTGEVAHLYYVDSGEQPTHYQFPPEPPAQTVTIRFDKNAADATGEMSALTKNKGEEFPLPDSEFTYDGHTFQGWSESATEGEVHSVGESYSTQVDVTLYARWQENPANKVTVSFDANGGEGVMQPVQIDEGSDYTLPTGDVVLFTKQDCEFGGWTLSAGAEETVSVLEHVAEDTTVYAKWNSSTPVVEKTQKYFETKSWFNSGDEHEHVYVYAYTSEPFAESAPFPGEEATYVQNLEDGKKLFSFEVDSSFEYVVISKVVDETKAFQTVDIALGSIGAANCIYLDAEAAPVDPTSKISVGFYNFALGLSSDGGQINVGGSIDVEILHALIPGDAEVTATCDPEEGVNVEIENNVATITSSVAGDYVITFSDESEYTATYELTVVNHVHSFVNHECACGAIEEGYTKVTFNVTHDVGMGNTMIIVGSFNEWSTTTGAIVLEWSEGNVWTGSVIWENGAVEFKAVISVNGGENFYWENGGNHQETPSGSTVSYVWTPSGFGA